MTDFGVLQSVHYYIVECTETHAQIREIYKAQVETPYGSIQIEVFDKIKDRITLDFNARLKKEKLKEATFEKIGITKIDRFLGSELVILFHALSDCCSTTHETIIQRWLAFRPEERWYLFQKVASENGFKVSSYWGTALMHILGGRR